MELWNLFKPRAGLNLYWDFYVFVIFKFFPLASPLMGVFCDPKVALVWSTVQTGTLNLEYFVVNFKPSESCNNLSCVARHLLVLIFSTFLSIFFSFTSEYLCVTSIFYKSSVYPAASRLTRPGDTVDHTLLPHALRNFVSRFVNEIYLWMLKGIWMQWTIYHVEVEKYIYIFWGKCDYLGTM